MRAIEFLRKELSNGVVSFSYAKKDGRIREAKGTTNSDVIGENYKPMGGFGPKSYGYVSYWDVDKNSWRCFNPNKLISIKKINIAEVIS